MLAPPTGVLSTHTGTTALIRSMAREDLRPGRRVLDMGTGSWAVAAKASVRGAAVTAVALSRWSLAVAFLAGMLHGRRVDVRRGELFAPVRGQRFDLIVANPQSPPSAGGAPGTTRSRERAGRRFLERLCSGCPAMLARHGVLLIVQSPLSDISRTCRMLRQAGLRTSVAEATGPRSGSGPAAAASAPRLVVVRGVRP